MTQYQITLNVETLQSSEHPIVRDQIAGFIGGSEEAHDLAMARTEPQDLRGPCAIR
jgi:hypothetical protein